MSKQYGLIIPSKNKSLITKPGDIIIRPSIFDEDSDSDTEKVKKPTGISKTIKRLDRVQQNKALEEDPTVYQYDEVYDDMDKKRKESKLSRKDLDKKPKYINMLLAAAERRKKENERRIEREVQKEREAEGEEFKDKESFVTSAYRKKLEERKLLEEQEKREAYLESIGQVEKQGNLDGFYRHLYDQKVKYEDEEVNVKSEPKSPKNDVHKLASDSENQSDIEANKIPTKKSAKNRKYRKHESSDDEKSEDEKEDEIKKEHLPSNLDADSDFSIDSSDTDDDEEKKCDLQSQDESKVKKTDQLVNEVIKNEDDGQKENTTSVKNEGELADDGSKEKEEKEEPPPKKPKIDIWKKRTVGEVYEAAVKRYFERKALRESQL